MLFIIYIMWVFFFHLIVIRSCVWATMYKRFFEYYSLFCVFYKYNFCVVTSTIKKIINDIYEENITFLKKYTLIDNRHVYDIDIVSFNF